MQNLKVRAMAAAMAAITAVTPVLSTYTEVFAETVDDYSGSESVDGTVKIETEAGIIRFSLLKSSQMEEL